MSTTFGQGSNFQETFQQQLQLFGSEFTSCNKSQIRLIPKRFNLASKRSRDAKELLKQHNRLFDISKGQALETLFWKLLDHVPKWM